MSSQDDPMDNNAMSQDDHVSNNATS